MAHPCSCGRQCSWDNILKTIITPFLFLLSEVQQDIFISFQEKKPIKLDVFFCFESISDLLENTEIMRTGACIPQGDTERQFFTVLTNDAVQRWWESARV